MQRLYIKGSIMTFSLLDIMYAEIAEATCSFCFKPCERYVAPLKRECLDFKYGDETCTTRVDDHPIYYARKRRASLLKEAAEARKYIEEEIANGKHPEEVNQSYYLKLLTLLVKEEKIIELMEGIYCMDCTRLLQDSMCLQPFH